MNTQDLINGLFEFFGGVLSWMNVFQLIKDKSIRGIHWFPPLFFTTWGFWNLYYYPHLHQWVSFCGGLMVTLENIVWVSLMIKFKNESKN